MKKIAIIFAGGIGRRMNAKAIPKQFLKLHEKEIIIYTIEHFQRHEEIDSVVVACVADGIEHMQHLIQKYDLTKVKAVVPGGASGQESIYNGLKKAAEIMPGEAAIALVHDGVRPLIDEDIISRCITSVEMYGSAVTIAPAIETIINVKEDDRIEHITERSKCFLARAPQCFLLEELLAAHEKAISDNMNDFIDSASMMKYYGKELRVVKGPVENIKITTPMDFYTFRALFEARENSQLYGLEV